MQCLKFSVYRKKFHFNDEDTMPRNGRRKKEAQLDLDAEIDMLAGVPKAKAGASMDSIAQMKRRLAELKEAKALGRSISADAGDYFTQKTEEALAADVFGIRSASAPAAASEEKLDAPYTEPPVPTIKWLKRQYKSLKDVHYGMILEKVKGKWFFFLLFSSLFVLFWFVILGVHRLLDLPAALQCRRTGRALAIMQRPALL